MSTAILWKSPPDLRPWASVGLKAKEHLLAQLLHANLLDIASCNLVLDAAYASAAESGFEKDLGFFDSVGVHFSKSRATIDHVITGYGTCSLPANELVRLVILWMTVLQSPVSMKDELEIDVAA